VTFLTFQHFSKGKFGGNYSNFFSFFVPFVTSYLFNNND